MKCPSCDRINTENSNFCDNCAFDFSEINTPENQPDQIKQPIPKTIESKSNIFQWILTISVSLGSAVVAPFLIGFVMLWPMSFLGLNHFLPIVDQLYFEFAKIVTAGSMGAIPMYFVFKLAPNNKLRASLILGIFLISINFLIILISWINVRAIIEGITITTVIIYLYMIQMKNDE